MASSPSLLLLPLAAAFLVVAAASSSSPTAVDLASGGGGGTTTTTKRMTHVRVYVHERFSGRNATVATVAPSPLGGDSTFGEVGALDDELRAGPGAASALVGRYRGVFVGSGLADDDYVSAVTVAFFAASGGSGGTLSLQGQYRFPGGDDGTVERAVVGGTGRFRMARGYSLLKLVSSPRKGAVFQLDLFVFTPSGGGSY